MQNQGEALYIINSARNCISSTSQEVVYHQLRKKLYIIKPTEIHTYGVMRYNNGIAVIDDIHANA